MAGTGGAPLALTGPATPATGQRGEHLLLLIQELLLNSKTSQASLLHLQDIPCALKRTFI